MTQTTEHASTYERYLGVINKDLKEPVVEAGGKAWWTMGGKIAVMYDDWEFEGETVERLPSGTVAVDPRGNEVVVP